MRTILPYQQNPALRQKAFDIPHGEITSENIQTLIREMKALLSKEEYGVALAAPQLGEALKLFVVSGKALAKRESSSESRSNDDDFSDSEKDGMPGEDQVYINPVLLKISRKKTDKHEGCLSIRGQWGIVPRAEKATVTAYDENGRKFTRGASGFLAHIFQHEMDHLDGILYTDKANEVYDDDADDHE